METVPIFEDDIVEMIYQCKKNGLVKRKVGTILESSQNISSDEEDEDNDSLYQSLRKNTVRVAWHPSGKTEVIEEVKLNILERSLLPGDIVTRLLNGQESQKGYVTNCKMSCVLQCLTQPFIIFDVDSSLLVDFLPFHSEHQQVYMDGWVGNVDKISERILLKFPDGAKCELSSEELVGNLTEFYDLNDKRDRSSEFFTNSFYVGQLLKGQFGLLEGCNWLEQTKGYSGKSMKKNKHKMVMVTVEELEVLSVDVMWLCRGYSEASSGDEVNKHPPNVISGKDLERLKILDYFEACDYALGSKAYYTVRKSDRVIQSNGINKEDVRNEFISTFHAKDLSEKGLHVTESDCNSTESKVSAPSTTHSETSLPADAVEVELLALNANLSHSPTKLGNNLVSKKSDGLVQTNTRSQMSVPSFSRKHKHQLRQGNKASSKKKKFSQKISFGRPNKKFETLEPGTRIPVEVIALHSKIEVLWQDGTRDGNISSGDLLPVQYVDDLEFFPGDYVSPAHPTERLSLNHYGVIQKVNHLERTCIVQWYSDDGRATSSSVEYLGEREEVSVFDIKEHSDLKFRPGAVVVRVGGFQAGQDAMGAHLPLAVGGQVLESGVDGRLLVHWADGFTSYCKPIDLFLITSDISDVGSSEDESEYSDSDDSENDRMSTNSTGSWEWETEEEVEEEAEDCPAEGGNGPAEKLKSDRQTLIEEMEVQDLERNISFFMAMKESMEQHLVTLQSILSQEKTFSSTEPRKIASTPVEDLSESVSPAKQENSMPQIGCSLTDQINLGLDGTCDFDGFMAVVLDMSNLHRTMHRMDNARLILTWSTMKKYLEAVQDQMKRAKSYNHCRKTFAKARQSFEINSKMAVEVQTKEKPEVQNLSSNGELKADEEASVDGLQSLSISSLFKVFDAIRPDKTPYDIIRTFQTFIRNLVLEFDECRELCLKSLALKQKLSDVQFIDALPCRDKNDSRSEDAEEVFKDAREEEPSAGGILKDEVVAGNVDGTPVVETRADPLGQGFVMLESVPDSHHFKKNNFNPVNPKTFFSAVRKETNLLKTCLPKGIHVRGFESRMDLFSSMIEGPSNTPYEDGLFFFDVQLSPDYPKSPPKLHYVSYCSDRLNPNLYEDGKVCVSLLGTWSGRGTEIWNPSESNLLQVLVSIQGLILNPEPYYNEAGYERQKGTQLGMENCRMYNEMAIIKLVQAMTKLLVHPYDMFEMEIMSHLRQNSEKFVNRLRSWSTISADSAPSTPEMKKQLSPDNQNATSVKDQDESSAASSATETTALANTTLLPDATTTTTTEDATSPATSTTPALDTLRQSSGFPLFPASRGFKITLAKCLDQYVDAAISRSILPGR